MNYPNPFIPQRADPYVVKGPDGNYYFTASYPAFMNVDATGITSTNLVTITLDTVTLIITNRKY